MGKATEHGNTVGVKAENADNDGGADQRDERAGEPAVHTLGGSDDGEGDHADADSPAVRLVELSCRRPDSMKRGAADRWQAQEVGELVHNDDDRHAGEEAGDDRRGQELGDPSEPQETDEGHDRTDHHGEDPDQVDVAGRVGRSEVCDPDREQRGDRGVRSDRHLRV